MLVCIGSALVMIVSIRVAHQSWPHGPGINITVDPARIAYGVMTGVGFLGAGTIIHNRGSVRGLTTAAGLWCVAGIGLGMGLGMYVLSVLATVIVVIALWLLDYLEDGLPKTRYRTVTIRAKYEPGCIGAAVAHFKEFGLDVIDASFERSLDLREADIHLKVAFVNVKQYYGLERQLEGDERYQLLSTRET
jgi:putative Mg2+ transporter-C (MgtC) family protein